MTTAHDGDCKFDYLSQRALPLYFGLGDATKIGSIEVDWPSGRKPVVRKDLHENQTVEQLLNHRSDLLRPRAGSLI